VQSFPPLNDKAIPSSLKRGDQEEQPRRHRHRNSSSSSSSSSSEEEEEEEEWRQQVSLSLQCPSKVTSLTRICPGPCSEWNTDPPRGSVLSEIQVLSPAQTWFEIRKKRGRRKKKKKVDQVCPFFWFVRFACSMASLSLLSLTPLSRQLLLRGSNLLLPSPSFSSSSSPSSSSS